MDQPAGEGAGEVAAGHGDSFECDGRPAGYSIIVCICMCIYIYIYDIMLYYITSVS